MEIAAIFATVFGMWLLVITLDSAIKHKFVSTVALRHLWTRGISYVAILLITCLVVMYLLVISVLEGFKEHYMDKLQSIMAHQTVGVGNLAWGIQYPEKWADELSKVDPEIKGVSIGLETPAMAFLGNARTVGTLRGVDLGRELKFGRLREILHPPDLTDFGMHKNNGKEIPGCILGGAWRKSYNLSVGQRVTFLFSDEDGDPRSLGFEIIGFYEGKNPYLEMGAYVDRQYLAKQIKVEGMAKTLFVWMKDPNSPELNTVREKVRAKMADLLTRDAPQYPKHVNEIEVQTWQEKDNNFYQAITRENFMMRFIMCLFLLLVGFILYLIFGRLVAEKGRDIGALRAIGASPSGIRGCFLMQGFYIGVLGVGVGLITSYFTITWINTIARTLGVDPFPNDSFGVDRIPTHTLPLDIYLISGVSLFFTLLGAFVPAVRASKLNPVECLRQE